MAQPSNRRLVTEAALAQELSDFKALPPGGTSGQVLAKTSNANYAVGWFTPSGGGGSFAVPIFDTEAEALAALSAGHVEENSVVGIRS